MRQGYLWGYGANVDEGLTPTIIDPVSQIFLRLLHHSRTVLSRRRVFQPGMVMGGTLGCRPEGLRDRGDNVSLYVQGTLKRTSENECHISLTSTHRFHACG
jgi:hypothetical protein